MKIRVNTKRNIGDCAYVAAKVDGEDAIIKVRILGVTVRYDSAYMFKTDSPEIGYAILPCMGYENARLEWPYMAKDDSWDFPITYPSRMIFSTRKECKEDMETELPF